jgi:hypothetical protein
VGGETSFTIPFPYINSTDIVVTDDGTTVAATIIGSVANLGYAAIAGHIIKIARETEVESPRALFTDPSAILASDLNVNVSQSLYRLQELETSIESLGTGTGSGNLPIPAGTSRFLVSEPDGLGGNRWAQKTTGQVSSILGISGSIIPSPTAGIKFLVTDASSAVYELATIAEAKTALGIGASQLPDPNGFANGFITTNTAGTAYELNMASTARSRLGLGSAATLNTGTSVGTIPLLVSGASSAALPSVSGENLTGVNKTIDYAMWERKVQTTLPVSSGANVIDAWTSVTHSSGNPVVATISPATSGWIALDPTLQNRLRLNPGTYYIKAESVVWNANAAAVLSFYTWTDAGAAISPGGSATRTIQGLPVTVHDNLSTAGSSMLGKSQVATVEAVFRVTGNTAYVAIDASRIGNQNSGTPLYAGSSVHPSVRIHVWKIA